MVSRFTKTENTVMYLDCPRRIQSQSNIDEDGQDVQSSQEKPKPFYRYSKLITLCCCWLLFTVRNVHDRYHVYIVLIADSLYR